MDIAAIRRAIAAASRTVVDASGARLEASHFVPDSIDPPFAYPAATDGNYDETTDLAAGVVVTVRVLTSRAEDQSGQELLDGYLADSGPTSVKAAIEADPTLGGLVDDLAVTGWSGHRLYEIGGVDYYGAELTVVILA
ncbi:MAG TPA: hypothetical protein VFR67_05925 [Pilimelia sp.]|nr:hypothetical protein [Pilimelia sp.]